MESVEIVNFLTAENGSKVVDCSSSYKQNLGDHVLVENRRVMHPSNLECLAQRLRTPPVLGLRHQQA